MFRNTASRMSESPIHRSSSDIFRPLSRSRCKVSVSWIIVPSLMVGGMLSSCRTVVALVGDSFHEAVEPEAVRTPERNLRDKIELERNYIAQRAGTKLLISLS